VKCKDGQKIERERKGDNVQLYVSTRLLFRVQITSNHFKGIKPSRKWIGDGIEQPPFV
jgi:hypothetical protein